MKNIIKFAVGNPVTICMVVFALLLLGKVSYDQLSVDLLPDLNNPRLFIELKAGERPPEEIEKQFVKNMESMAIRQSDVTQVSSVIKAGTARITVEYTWTKDMDEAFLDLQKAMNPFAQNKDITELKITQHDANLSPVVLVGMSHQSITDMAELRKIAESYIRNELIRLEGVAEVTLSGEEVSTLTIQTDPYKLDAFQLKIEDIASRIESNNQSISGGRVSELLSKKSPDENFEPFVNRRRIEFLFKRPFGDFEYFSGRKARTHKMIKEEIMQNVRSDNILGFLFYLAVFRGDKLGAYGCCKNILKNFFGFPFAVFRDMPHDIPYERFGNGCVNAVHGHMIAVIRCPTEREFGKIARPHDESSVFVRYIHKNLRAFSRLRIFVSHVGYFFVLSDVFKMTSYGIGYIDLAESYAELFA